MVDRSTNSGVLLRALLVCILATTTGIAADTGDPRAKVKVFILAGQSNMEGHGQLASLDHLGSHPKHGHLLKKLKAADGSWIVRDDVTIAWRSEHREKKSGPLTVGWGAGPQAIGPELMFGTIVGDHCDAPVLLIKAAWGGRDVFCDFRSPSAGELTRDEARILERDRRDGRKREVGRFYRKMVDDIRRALKDIDSIVPGYDDRGYELVGMAWFQGWNDFCEWHLKLDDRWVGATVIERYPHNLAAMIRDLRKDLNAPDLPIAIGEMGVWGHDIDQRAKRADDHEARSAVAFRKAQRAVADDPSLANVAFVPTADFWDSRLQELRGVADRYWNEKREKGIESTRDNELPTKALNDEYWRRGGHWVCHYNGSATTYSLVGHALARALLSRE